MPSLKPAKFRILATLAIVVSAVWFAWSSAGAGDYFSTLAGAEAKEGSAQTNLTAAIYHYQLASLVSFNDSQHINQLADLYLRQNRPDLAIRALKRRPTDQNRQRVAQIYLESSQFELALKTINSLLEVKQTPEVLILKSKTLLELDRAGEATGAAKQAASFALGNSNSQLWLGLCLAVEGNRGELKLLMATVTAPEALEPLKQANISTLHLARVLYAQGLLRSAERALAKYPDQNTEVAIFKAEIALSAVPLTKQDMDRAVSVLKQGIIWDPASVVLRKQLKSVYSQQGNTAAAASEAELIQQLESGKI